jgi:hypothetical protein
MNEIRLKDGEPCSHPGCASHVSHPCEVCGRRGAQGEAIFARSYPPVTAPMPLTDAVRQSLQDKEAEIEEGHIPIYDSIERHEPGWLEDEGVLCRICEVEEATLDDGLCDGCRVATILQRGAR